MSDGNAEAYSLAVDMWSIGVILFILLSGYSPFGALLTVGPPANNGRKSVHCHRDPQQFKCCACR